MEYDVGLCSYSASACINPPLGKWGSIYMVNKYPDELKLHRGPDDEDEEEKEQPAAVEAETV